MGATIEECGTTSGVFKDHKELLMNFHAHNNKTKRCYCGIQVRTICYKVAFFLFGFIRSVCLR